MGMVRSLGVDEKSIGSACATTTNLLTESVHHFWGSPQMRSREIFSTKVVTGKELADDGIFQAKYLCSNSPTFFPDIRSLVPTSRNELEKMAKFRFIQLPRELEESCKVMTRIMREDVSNHPQHRERSVVIYPQVIDRCLAEFVNIRDSIRALTKTPDFNLFRGFVCPAGKLASSHMKPTVEMEGLHTDMGASTLKACYDQFPNFRRIVINLTNQPRRVSVIPKLYEEIVKAVGASEQDDSDIVVQKYLSLNPEVLVVEQRGLEAYEFSPFEIVHDGSPYARTESDCILILDYTSR